jgi:hypothetical protein
MRLRLLDEYRYLPRTRVHGKAGFTTSKPAIRVRHGGGLHGTSRRSTKTCWQYETARDVRDLSLAIWIERGEWTRNGINWILEDGDSVKVVVTSQFVRK